MFQPFAAHFADREIGNGIAQTFQRNFERPRHRHGRQQVQHAMAPARVV